MKKMKKILALVIGMMMIMGITAMAATKNDTITVTGTKSGETYNLYKLFDLSVDDEENPTAFSYTINNGWAAFFAAADEETNTPAGAGRQYITVNDAGYVTAISDAAALAKAASNWTGKPSYTQTVIATGDSVEFSNLQDGYWLITSSLGTICMAETTPDASAVTVKEKNPEDTITKEVQEDSTQSWGENNDAQVGDTVDFRSTVKIVKGTRNVIVHDKMDAGLDLIASSISIAGLTKDTNYTINTSPTDGDTFDIAFVQSWIDGLDFGTDGYKEYVISYSAKLNDAAVVKNADGVAIVDQDNKTHVSYGDDTDSQEDTTTTTTHKFSVFKHAANSSDNLADAEFSLKKDGTVINLVKIDDNNYRVVKDGETGITTFKTVENGDIYIWGVDSDDDYTLLEVNPPKGYNALTEEVTVDVDAGNGTRVDVVNNMGTELPSTGGIGTTIFYVIGAILVLGAGVLLVSRKRMSAK